MFALVALVCLYLGTSNLSAAFNTSFNEWTGYNWVFLIMGIILMFTGAACVWQASKDFKKAKDKAVVQVQENKKAKQSIFFEDKEFLEELKEQEDETLIENINNDEEDNTPNQ